MKGFVRRLPRLIGYARSLTETWHAIKEGGMTLCRKYPGATWERAEELPPGAVRCSFCFNPELAGYRDGRIPGLGAYGPERQKSD